MVATLLAAFTIAVAPAMLSEVTMERAQRLSKGINLSHWWAQAGDYNLDRINAQMTGEDFQQIKDSGFNHVRLTLSWVALADEASTDHERTRRPRSDLDPKKVKALRSDIKEIQDAGLAVIVDVHPDDGLKAVLKTESAAFLEFWRALATELKDTDPDWTFIEPLNEPVIENEVWLPLQGQAVEAIRAILPSHTMIVSGAKWSGIDDFLAMSVYPDKNLVYNFHTYDPMTFTHQSAGWGPVYLRDLKNLPYPSNPSALSSVLAALDDDVRGKAKEYGDERWNYDHLDRLIRKCSEWGRKNKVPVTCNEFGCYVKAPRDSRIRYITDVRKALEANGIGWTMWDYAGDFKAFSGSPGNRSTDGDVLKALGLRS